MLDKESAEIRNKRKSGKHMETRKRTVSAGQERDSDIRVVTKEREGSGNRKRNIIRT